MRQAHLHAVASFLLITSCTCARGDHLAPFLTDYCTSCHNAERKAARLDLASLAFAPTDPANAQVWVLVHDRVAAGEMPPRKADQPGKVARDGFTRQLAERLTEAEAKQVAEEGRATRRRLNRQEYEYTLRDL